MSYLPVAAGSRGFSMDLSPTSPFVVVRGGVVRTWRPLLFFLPLLFSSCFPKDFVTCVCTCTGILTVYCTYSGVLAPLMFWLSGQPHLLLILCNSWYSRVWIANKGTDLCRLLWLGIY
jgi:hypothetical protein